VMINAVLYAEQQKRAARKRLLDGSGNTTCGF
jgi:hypothetical protein